MCIISQRKSLSKFKRSVFERSWWIYLLFDQAKHILGCHKAIPGRALAPPQPTNANIENMSLRCSCNPWMPVRRSKPNVDSFEIQRGYDLALQINFWFFEAFPTRVRKGPIIYVPSEVLAALRVGFWTFGPAWLRPSRPSCTQAVWQMQPCIRWWKTHPT